tara:strand:- start:69 stop:344 length:276 start_codon:yes stop_codon:yes gene_type:complete
LSGFWAIWGLGNLDETSIGWSSFVEAEDLSALWAVWRLSNLNKTGIGWGSLVEREDLGGFWAVWRFLLGDLGCTGNGKESNKGSEFHFYNN